MEKSVVDLELVYGDSVRGTVRFAGNAQLENANSANEVFDLESAVSQALQAPLDFPPVEQAIVPGDRVVLAVDPSVPRMVEVVQQILNYLQRSGFPSEQFTVVVAGHLESDAAALAKLLPDDVTIELHDADDQTKVAYVAANKQGEPIYMNRSLVDADVVIPVMCARGRTAIDYEGAYGVFPLLTDRRTRGQFYSLRQLANPTEHERLTAWADEAAWWVGVLVAVQVVPAPEGGIAHVLAGSPQPLEAAVQEAMKEVWQSSVDQTYDAVIALIDGGPGQQTWDSVARVLASATPLVSPDGALIVCTELSQRPGPALRKLKNPNRREDVLAKQLSSDASDDALAAAVLLESLDASHIYLLSDLPRDVVEGLGISAIQNLQQAENVIHQRGSCLVIGSAQHRMVHQTAAVAR